MPTNDPIACSILELLADKIEACPLPSWRSKPAFRRVKFQTPEGQGEASLPEKSDPNRMRFFDAAWEGSGEDEGAASDDERWTFSGTILIKLYYPDLAAVPGEGNKAMLASRLQIADFVNLTIAIVARNVFTHEITGAGSVRNLGAVYTAGLTEWRLEVRWEEAVF